MTSHRPALASAPTGASRQAHQHAPKRVPLPRRASAAPVAPTPRRRSRDARDRLVRAQRDGGTSPIENRERHHAGFELAIARLRTSPGTRAPSFGRGLTRLDDAEGLERARGLDGSSRSRPSIPILQDSRIPRPRMPRTAVVTIGRRRADGPGSLEPCRAPRAPVRRFPQQGSGAGGSMPRGRNPARSPGARPIATQLRRSK